MEQLQCVVQNYARGKRGRSSRVAQLMGDSGSTVNDEATYAELWMGTHPSGPAMVVRDGREPELLSEWLKSHPVTAGAAQNGDLPFLFKVLSVEKALSIQAHPDLALARSLHSKFPDVYKDPNHKPEMAIALTPFEALCQFRPIEEILEHLKSIPELKALVGDQITQLLMERRDRTALQEWFREFIHTDEATIATNIASIRARLGTKPTQALTPVETLVLRLIGQYDVDIGCFCPYLLNYVTLQPGEAVFLGANEPHAYLSGDCIECMACSDNVVRAGLTPKFIDKETLCGMLTYRTEPPTILTGDRVDDVVRIYSSPVPEFEVEAVRVSSGQSYTMTKRRGASVLLITSGAGEARLKSQNHSFDLCMGRTYLIGANESVELDAANSTEPLMAFRASPNEHVDDSP